MKFKKILFLVCMLMSIVKQVNAECYNINGDALSTQNPVVVNVKLTDIYTGTTDGGILAGNNYSPTSGHTSTSSNMDINGIQCDYSWAVELVPAGVAHSLDNNSITTDVPGVNIALQATVSSLQAGLNTLFTIVNSGKNLNVTAVNASLVKKDIGVRRKPGVIKNGKFAELWIKENGTRTIHLVDINLMNDVQVDIGTCSYSPAQDIHMDTEMLSSFTHVGYTSPDKTFAISMSCQPDLKISSVFTGIDSGNNEVFGLDPVPGSASGVGIQLYSLGSSFVPQPATLLKNNVITPLFQTLLGSAGTTQVQFKAHYYQLKNSVSAGSVSTTLNYVITYD